MEKRILILGIDTFARKNKAQIELAQDKGYVFDIISSDFSGDSKEVFNSLKSSGSRLFCNGRISILTIILFFRCLANNRYHHVELYSAGKLGFIYALILRMFRYRFLVIERGDIGCIADYPILVRFSMLLAYRLASGVIYKEIYMKPLLENLGVKKLHFLPNCAVSISSDHVLPINKRVGFLWVNRIIPQRRAAWLLRSFSSDELASSCLNMLGFRSLADKRSDSHDIEIELLHLQGKNRHLHLRKEPFDFYEKSCFFCLASELVFGNNALLEAMSYGMVPIVTKTPGVELIVEDGVNGIVTEMNEHDYHQGLVEASKLDARRVQEMSDAVINTIRRKFSPESWADNLDLIYRMC